MDHEAINEAMERALQQPPTVLSGKGDGEHSRNRFGDDGWGRIRGADSTARPFKTKGSWEFARQTLGCNSPVDILRPLVVMAAEKVTAHMPAEEDKKLASHNAALINSTGIKRRTTERTDMTRLPFQTQKKARRDEQEFEGGRGESKRASIMTGMPPT